MKALVLITFLLTLSFSAQAKEKSRIYDAFMCYTTFDTVVLFGVLKPKGTLRINYHALEQNPTTIDLKVSRYQRSDSSIFVTGEYQGQEVINVRSQGGFGKADIDLRAFPGTENTEFSNEDVICYFGKFED